MNNNEMKNNKKLHSSSLALHDEVLLGGQHRLLGLVVGELPGAEVGGGAALGEQHRGLGGGVVVEPGPGEVRRYEGRYRGTLGLFSPGELLDGGLGGGVGLNAGQTGGGGGEV